MITKIRNNFKESGAKFILWIMLFSMVVVFLPGLFKKGGEGHYATVAHINGHSIDLIDFERRVYHETERLNMFRMQFGAQADFFLKSLGMNDPKTLALNGLIQEALLEDVAKKLGIQVSPQFIAEKLQDASYIYEELSDVIPFAVIDQQGLNISLVNRYLAQNRLSMQDFEAMIENKIKRSLVQSLVSSSAYVSNKQIKDYFIQNYLAKEYMIVALPLDYYLQKAKSSPVKEQDISAYFEKEHKNYWVPEKRSGKQWKFSPQDYGIVVTQPDIEAYYANHKSQFIESPLQVQVRRILFKVAGDNEKSALEAQKKAEAVKKDLVANPFQFEELAKKHSEDSSSAAQGGLVSFFKKGEKDSEFERAAFRLQKDGDISDIIPTRDGLEILQRVSRKPATYKSLSQVETTIKKAVSLQKFKLQFAEDVSKIMALQNKEKKAAAFQELIQNKKAAESPLALMQNDGSPLAEKLFKARQDDWFYLNTNDYGILAVVDSVQKSHKPEIASVKKQLEEDLYRKNALSALESDLQSARDKNIPELKKLYPFAVIKKTGMVKKDDKEKIQELVQEGIPASSFESLEDVGSELTFIEGERGYLVKVINIEPYNQESFEANKNTIANLLYEEQKQVVQRGYIASLYRNATIKITESLVTIKEENSL